MPVKPRPLWRRPKCGARLVTRNLSHSCGKFSLAALFARSEPQVLPLFRKFAALARRSGRLTMIPQKTRVVFIDPPLLDWLRESYHYYGRQERLGQ